MIKIALIYASSRSFPTRKAWFEILPQNVARAKFDSKPMSSQKNVLNLKRSEINFFDQNLIFFLSLSFMTFSRADSMNTCNFVTTFTK